MVGIVEEMEAYWAAQDRFGIPRTDLTRLPMIDTRHDPKGYTSAYPEAYEAVHQANQAAKQRGIPLLMPAWPLRRIEGPGR